MRAAAGIMRAVDNGALIPFLKTGRPLNGRKSRTIALSSSWMFAA